MEVRRRRRGIVINDCVIEEAQVVKREAKQVRLGRSGRKRIPGKRKQRKRDRGLGRRMGGRRGEREVGGGSA